MSQDVYVSFGADTGGLEAGVALAKAEVTAMTRELTALAREMVKTGASADSELGQKLRALGGELAEAKEQVSGFKEKLKPEGEEGGFLSRMKEQLEGTLAPISAVRENLGEMVELLAAAFAVEKIADWISETTEAAEKIERMAAKLGISVGQVQEMGAVAKLTGGDVDQMASQLERLQLQLAKTGSASSPVAAALKVLGINLAEFRSASIAGQVDQMAEAFSRFADGSGKTAAAMALLGKTGADLLPFLDRGKEGLDELRKAAEATGVMMSAATIEAFSKTREDLNLLSLAWTGLSQKLLITVNPLVDAATKALTHLIESANPAELQGYLTTLATSLVGGAANVATFAVSAEEDWNKLVAAIEASIGPVTGAMQKIADGLNYISNLSKTLTPNFDFGQATGMANMLDRLGVISDETAAKWKQQAAAARDSALGATQSFGGLDATAARYSMRLSDIASGAENAKRQIAALLAEGAKTSQLSRHGEGEGGLAGEGGPVKPQVPQMDIGGASKAAAEALKIAEAEASAEVDAFKKAATAKEKLLDEQLKMHQLTMSQWQAQTVDALTDEEQDIKSAYARELQAAAGHSSQIIAIRKKEADAIADIELKISEANAKAAEATVAAWKSVGDGIAGILNSQVNGLLRGTTSIAQAFTNMAASIVEDLIKVTIKILAEAAALEALSLATGGALGGFGAGGVGGFIAGMLPHFAAGTPYVQNTGLAVIHQGEMITPAGQNPNNPSGRGSRGAGGDTHNYHIYSQSADPNQVARQVARQWDRRPSSRPSY